MKKSSVSLPDIDAKTHYTNQFLSNPTASIPMRVHRRLSDSSDEEFGGRDEDTVSIGGDPNDMIWPDPESPRRQASHGRRAGHLDPEPLPTDRKSGASRRALQGPLATPGSLAGSGRRQAPGSLVIESSKDRGLRTMERRRQVTDRCFIHAAET